MYKFKLNIQLFAEEQEADNEPLDENKDLDGEDYHVKYDALKIEYDKRVAELEKLQSDYHTVKVANEQMALQVTHEQQSDDDLFGIFNRRGQ